MQQQITKWKRYPEYKESGVEWLGEIPKHWDLKPGLIFFSQNRSDNKGMKQGRVLSLSYGKIIVKPEEKLTGLVPESFETYQIVAPGDIIIRCTDLQNDKISLRTGLSKNDGIITNAYLNLKVKQGQDSRFLHYFLYSVDTTKVLYKFGSGLRQNLSFEDFKRLPVLHLELREQTAIADFLDEKTAKIDQAIKQKEQMITLLQERKQILIQNAVTKGLDPNVPMKDSGIEWIGEIPEHWEALPIKRVVKAIGGFAYPTSAFTTDEGIPLVKMTSLNRGILKELNVSKVKLQCIEESSQLKVGDLLYGLSGSIGKTGSLGNYATVRERDLPAVLNQRLANFRADEKNQDSIRLLKYQLQTASTYSQVLVKTTGTAQFNVSVTDVSNSFIASPPLSEQTEIATFLDEKTAKIDDLILAR